MEIHSFGKDATEKNHAGETESHAPDPQELASELAPVLRSACKGSLGPVSWFQSPWQHGGAATGYANWSLPDGSTTQVVVKLPVSFNEFFWTTRLSPPDNSTTTTTPRVLASGDHLGNYDFAWIVIERAQGKVLGNDIAHDNVLALLKAVADLHRRASAVKPITIRDTPPPPNWERLISKAREAVVDNHLPHEHRWSESLKKVSRGLERLVAEWRMRDIDTWCHGDLHPGNAIVDSQDHLVLIDLGLVHAGHWVEDAVYLERQYWGHHEFLHGVKPVRALAQIRRDMGLSLGEEYTHIADLRRLLMASCVPAFLGREGNPAYIDAALGIIERLSTKLLH